MEGLPQRLSSKESTCNAGDTGDMGLIPGSGRSPGEGHGNPLQYSCLENPMDRGAWWARVHGVTKIQTWLSDLAHTRALQDGECGPRERAGGGASGPSPLWFWIDLVLCYYYFGCTGFRHCAKVFSSCHARTPHCGGSSDRALGTQKSVAAACGLGSYNSWA